MIIFFVEKILFFKRNKNNSQKIFAAHDVSQKFIKNSIKGKE